LATCHTCPVFNSDNGNWSTNQPNPHNATSNQGLGLAGCRVNSTQDFTDSIGVWRFQDNVHFECPAHCLSYDPAQGRCVPGWCWSHNATTNVCTWGGCVHL
jgi:hypothetical protein